MLTTIRVGSTRQPTNFGCKSETNMSAKVATLMLLVNSTLMSQLKPDETWLAPLIEGRSGLAAITASDLDAALDTLLPWDLCRRLDAEAPTHFSAPTGSNLAVDYAAEAGPTISVRVQELFGLAAHPSLAGGRVPLVLELLSPAHRPIQVTRDLPGFWRGSWASVKSEMKGRYPRHPWPDDPAAAPPTTRAKPRGT